MVKIIEYRRVVYRRYEGRLYYNPGGGGISLHRQIWLDAGNVIPDGWTSTMPNVQILKDLLEKTKGRLLVMNTKDLLFDRANNIPLDSKIEEYRQRMSKAERKEFESNLDLSELYTGFTVDNSDV